VLNRLRSDLEVFGSSDVVPIWVNRSEKQNKEKGVHLSADFTRENLHRSLTEALVKQKTAPDMGKKKHKYSPKV
jgi:hypothetical protein